MWQGKGCIIEIFLVDLWVINVHNFVSGVFTLKPIKPKNLKTFCRNLVFSFLGGPRLVISGFNVN